MHPLEPNPEGVGVRLSKHEYPVRVVPFGLEPRGRHVGEAADAHLEYGRFGRVFDGEEDGFTEDDE